MNINQRFLSICAFAILIIGVVFLGWHHIKQGKQLKSQQTVVEDLEQQLRAQKSLLEMDSLLVQGHYQDALAQYQSHETNLMEDGEFGVGLRVAIAKKLLEFEDDLTSRASVYPNVKDTLNVVEITEPNPKINQLDSLNFVLSKTKMQLAKMKRKLYQKSFGEYLTFTNSKGSQVHYVGQVEGGKANGYGVAILNTGSRYVGEWKNNERHGQGTFYWKDGEYYEGNYQSDKRNGQGTYFWPNGEKYIGQWKEDRRSGKGAFFGKDGKLMTKGIWENDKMITDTTKPTKKQRSKEKEMAAL
ncbi:MAG: hypothetical protein AAGC45_04625 [Bacteroidota bacterium]